jgi:hypothetical protein
MSKQPALTPRPGVGRCASSLAEAARTVPLPSNTMLNLIDSPSLSARVKVTYGQAMKTPFANPLHASEPYSVRRCGSLPHLHLAQLLLTIGLWESRSLRISRMAWAPHDHTRSSCSGGTGCTQLGGHGSHVPADAGVTHHQRPSLRLRRGPATRYERPL